MDVFRPIAQGTTKLFLQGASGIDTKHIAYSNLVRIAAICMNNAGTTTTGFGAQNGLIDLQTGLHGGSSNSIDEFGTDGGVGPFIGFR